MEYSGNIRKMESEYGDVIIYYLPLDGTRIAMNPLIGQRIILEYKGKINCIKCGRETKKSFAQGYCYPCFNSAPETEECVLRPELCRAHEGVARDMDFARQHCLIEHVVYLSLTSGLKVGVTRNTQIPTRWIDQGATQAIELARTPNRYTAGLMEVALKTHFSDKTNWRQMLSGSGPEGADLLMEKNSLSNVIPNDMKAYITKNDQVMELEYPVLKYPEKIKSLNFDKDPVISGILMGIKGQYLMFEDDQVVNIRKFGGYQISFQTTI